MKMRTQIRILNIIYGICIGLILILVIDLIV